MCNTNITCSMEHILQASLHHTHFWFHHTIKWSGNPTGPRSPAGFPQNINFTVQHMTGVGVFRFINREITRGQGCVWHVSVCYNTHRHGCLSLGQKPYGLQQLINIFVDVKQDFLHTSPWPLVPGSATFGARKDFFCLLWIRAFGNAVLSPCGFPQGKSVCSYHELRSTFSVTRQ